MDSKIEAAILKNLQWVRLSAEIRQHFGNEREYNRAVLTLSLQHQLKWDGVVKHVQGDREVYYGKVIEYSRDHLMLFPYHLSRHIIREMRVTPFQYYVQMVQYLFSTEQSYDQLPNFTAADVLRILGIGRNQYIEKMNQSRSRKLFRRKSAADVMPSVPVDDATIEAWWIVQPGCILQDDVKTLSADEKNLIDLLFESGPQKAGGLNLDILRKVHIRGLVYLDVPVNDDDCVSVPPLEGFVMNRVLGDYLENLLYKVFITIDEYSSVGELASILQIELDEVKHAVSIFCRLGFAKIKGLDMDMAELHFSWHDSCFTPKKDEDETGSLTDVSNGDPTDLPTSPMLDSTIAFKLDEEPTTPGAGPVNKRIGFMFDSTLTAFLMMGNLSPGLKNHAVTMFEVGKLADESVDSFLSELEKVVPEEEIQGEAKRYFDHAINLRRLIRFLRHNPSLTSQDPFASEGGKGPGLDLLRCESLRGLDKAALYRVLKKNYSLMVSLAPMSNEARPVCPLVPPHAGCPVPEVHSIWFKLFIYSLTSSHPSTALYRRGEVLKSLPPFFMKVDYLLLTPWGHDSVVIPSSIGLALVNDALKHHPVLVQSYGNSMNPKLTYIPFPKKSTENSRPSTFENHSTVQILYRELKLDHSCGFITMLNVRYGVSADPDRGLTNTDSSGPSSEDVLGDERQLGKEEEWILLDCCYGVPLFSASLSDEVCNRLLENGTFLNDSLNKLEDGNRSTGERLLQFIIEMQDLPLRISSALGTPTLELDNKEFIAVPTRNIFFHRLPE